MQESSRITMTMIGDRKNMAWKDQDEVGRYAHPISKYWKQKVGSNN